MVRFKEARDVRKEIALTKPAEEARFEREFQHHLDSLRGALAKKQKSERDRLDESLAELEWREGRNIQRLRKETRRRVQNLEHDMTHAHLLRSKEPAQQTVQVSMGIHH